MPFEPDPRALVTVGVFAVAYMAWLARETAHRRVDLYDFVLLSMVAVVPVFFTFAPEVADRISRMLGVQLPLIVMFGVLFVTVFVFINRLTIQVHELRAENRLLVQELSLLALETRKAPTAPTR